MNYQEHIVPFSAHSLRLKDGRLGIYNVGEYIDGGERTVILSEHPKNPGPRITDVVTEVATDVVLGLFEFNKLHDPRTVSFMEHYPAVPLDENESIETWAIVHMQWDVKTGYHSPLWTRLRVQTTPLQKAA